MPRRHVTGLHEDRVAVTDDQAVPTKTAAQQLCNGDVCHRWGRLVLKGQQLDRIVRRHDCGGLCGSSAAWTAGGYVGWLPLHSHASRKSDYSPMKGGRKLSETSRAGSAASIQKRTVSKSCNHTETSGDRAILRQAGWHHPSVNTHIHGEVLARGGGEQVVFVFAFLEPSHKRSGVASDQQRVFASA